MIQLQDVSKSFGEQLLFEQGTLAMSRGEKLGIVGRNGSGKSTLFKLISGEEIPDTGRVVIPNHYRIGRLKQELVFTAPTTLEEVCLDLPEESAHIGKKVLAGLGIDQDKWELPPSRLSGGQQVRLNLAKLLVAEVDLLLLDEPTNYLDILSIRWLGRFLKNWPREFLLITHDRAFMDQVVDGIVGVVGQRVRKVPGKTQDFYDYIQLILEQQQKAYESYQDEAKRVHDFVDRFGAKASKATQAKSRLKRLDKLTPVEVMSLGDQMQFRFKQIPFNGKKILNVENLGFHYPGGDWLYQNLNFSLMPGDKVGIIGANGMGKSTFLRLLQEELVACSGKIDWGTGFNRGYFGQSQVDALSKQMSIEEAVYEVNQDLGRAEVRKICGTMLFPGDIAEKKIGVLSGGERARVALGRVLAKPAHGLLLDEPTNHLDQESNEAMINAILEFNGVVLLVTHNERILSECTNKLLVFHAGEVEIFLGSYQDFLNKGGWEKEEKRLDSSSRNLQKSLKQLRAELVKERAKILKPLEFKVEKLEKDIESAEAQVEEIHQKLITISAEGKSVKIQELQVLSAQKQKEIEKLFTEYEQVSLELEETKKEFENKFKEMEE